VTQGPPPEIRVSPSIPPRGMTWPMVAYAVVRELPAILMILGGITIGIVLAMRPEPSAFHVLASVLGPGFIAALQRSKPAEALDAARFGVSPYRD
jgi:hypothetical protein